MGAVVKAFLANEVMLLEQKDAFGKKQNRTIDVRSAAADPLGSWTAWGPGTSLLEDFGARGQRGKTGLN